MRVDDGPELELPAWSVLIGSAPRIPLGIRVFPHVRTDSGDLELLRAAPQSLVDWDALGRLSGTLVLLMAVENVAAIAEALTTGGRDGGLHVARGAVEVTSRVLVVALVRAGLRRRKSQA